MVMTTERTETSTIKRSGPIGRVAPVGRIAPTRTTRKRGTEIGVERPATPGSVYQYLRISDDKTGKRAGVERQDEDNTKLVEFLGLPGPVERLEDNDISASIYSGKIRTNYQRLLTAITAGLVTDVICWHPDRLYRDPSEFESLCDLLVAHGVRLYAVNGGKIDVRTPEGRMFARQMSTYNTYFVEHMRDQVIRSSLQRAEQGLRQGGPRAFGWDKHGLTSLPAEIAVIRECTEAVLSRDDDVSCRQLARQIREGNIPRVNIWTRGPVPRPQGGTWTPEVVRAMLIRPCNAGLRVRHGDLWPAQWRAAVTREQWEAVRTILTDPSRITTTGPAPVSLLSGIARCPEGHVFHSGKSTSSNGKKREVYECRRTNGSSHLSRVRAGVDNMVIDFLCGVGDFPGYLAQEMVRVRTLARGEGPDASIEAKARVLKIRIRKLEFHIMGRADPELEGVTVPTAREFLNLDRAELAMLEREVAAHSIPDVFIGMSDRGLTPDQFRALPLPRRRELVKHLVNVTILPSPGGGTPTFIPRAVQITPRASTEAA